MVGRSPQAEGWVRQETGLPTHYGESATAGSPSHYMLSFPLKATTSSSDELAAGLTSVVRSTYGEFAAQALTSDVVAFRRAREAATSKKASNETEAAAVEEALVLYGAMLERLQGKLGTEVREERAMGFAWRACWEPTTEKKEPVRHHDLIAERAAVLFNLGGAPPLARARARGAPSREAARPRPAAAAAAAAADCRC